MFADRQDAARQLAIQLSHYKGQNPLILAIPRGAVPIGRTLANLLSGDLDVVLVHKLRAPNEPEVAVGSVDEVGWAYIAPYAAEIGADKAYIEAEKKEQLQHLRERRMRYWPIHPPIDPKDRIVIVVDDGLATGATMVAALHSVRQRQPAKLVCALPVASPRSLIKAQAMADEVVCLYAPDDFQAVAQYYRHFPQVEDDEVEALLRT